MKKITKSLMAVALSAAMVLSSTSAMAAEQTSTGNGAFENDDSAVPVYDEVTLPTVAAGTYNFTIDPQKLLNKYDSETYSDASATLLFNTVNQQAKIEALATAQIDGALIDGKLYTHTKVEADIDDDLKAAITVATSTITAVEPGFYLWVPDETTPIDYDGKYLEIDTTVLGTYFDITLTESAVDSIALKANHNAGSVVCADEIYMDEYVEATGSATDYVTLKADGSAIDTETATANQDINLYVTTDEAAFTQITKTNLATYVKFTPATNTYKGQSNKVKIINKSTKTKTVTAKVTVKNADGLTFKPEATYSSDTSASVYLAITDGSTPVAVAAADSVVSATKTFELAPADESEAITYQTTSTDDKTGGHVYKRYIQPDDGSKYSFCEFYITGSANSEEGAKEAWDAYNKALEANQTPKIPGIDVVYSINDKVDKYTLTAAGDNAPTFKVAGATVTSAAEGDEVTIVPAVVDGKVVDTVKYTPSGEEAVTVTPVSGAYKFTMPAKAVSVAVTYKSADKAPNIATRTGTYSKANGATFAVDLGAGSLAAENIANLEISIDGSSFMAYTGGYSLSEGTLTLNSGYMGGATAGSTRYVKVTFDDDEPTSVTLTLTVAD